MVEKNEKDAAPWTDWADLMAVLDFYTCPDSENGDYSDVDIRYLGGQQFRLTYPDGSVGYLVRSKGRWLNEWESSSCEIGYPGN